MGSTAGGENEAVQRPEEVQSGTVMFRRDKNQGMRHNNLQAPACRAELMIVVCR